MRIAAYKRNATNCDRPRTCDAALVVVVDCSKLGCDFVATNSLGDTPSGDADTIARERREAELHARAEAAVARAKSIKKGKRTPPRPLPLATGDGQPVRYPLRAFVQTWGELTNWWTHYDADTLAAELTDEQFENFLATADGTVRFADALRAARDGAAERPRLRAL